MRILFAKEREIKTNEILIKKAEIEAKKLECEDLEKRNQMLLGQKLIKRRNMEQFKILA